MRRDEAYLLDILLSASRALKYVDGLNWEEFETDELVQDAVIYPLEIMVKRQAAFLKIFVIPIRIFRGIRSSASETALSMNTSGSTAKRYGIPSRTTCQI